MASRTYRNLLDKSFTERAQKILNAKDYDGMIKEIKTMRELLYHARAYVQCPNEPCTCARDSLYREIEKLFPTKRQ